MLGTYGLDLGARDLYRVTPILTMGLGFCGLDQKTDPISYPLRQTVYTEELLQTGPPPSPQDITGLKII